MKYVSTWLALSFLLPALILRKIEQQMLQRIAKRRMTF